MLEKIDENFIKKLRVIARGIARGNCDPDELVNEAVEYLLKNKNKYKTHPNPIALAVLKMKGLHIDFIRKNKNLTALTDQEEKEMGMDEKIEISLECKKVLEIIKTMGEKCQEILMLAADGMSMKEMQEIINVESLGTVLSRLSNCRKELKGLTE